MTNLMEMILILDSHHTCILIESCTSKSVVRTLVAFLEALEVNEITIDKLQLNNSVGV